MLKFLFPAILTWSPQCILVKSTCRHLFCYSELTIRFRARDFYDVIIESLSRRRFCQHGRQPEVNRAVVDGEWWRQPFSFEINNGSHSAFTFVISNENDWRHHSPSITARFTSGWRPCWQKRRLLKLSNWWGRSPKPRASNLIVLVESNEKKFLSNSFKKKSLGRLMFRYSLSIEG